MEATACCGGTAGHQSTRESAVQGGKCEPLLSSRRHNKHHNGDMKARLPRAQRRADAEDRTQASLRECTCLYTSGFGTLCMFYIVF